MEFKAFIFTAFLMSIQRNLIKAQCPKKYSFEKFTSGVVFSAAWEHPSIAIVKDKFVETYRPNTNGDSWRNTGSISGSYPISISESGIVAFKQADRDADKTAVYLNDFRSPHGPSIEQNPNAISISNNGKTDILAIAGYDGKDPIVNIYEYIAGHNDNKRHWIEAKWSDPRQVKLDKPLKGLHGKFDVELSLDAKTMAVAYGNDHETKTYSFKKNANGWQQLSEPIKTGYAGLSDLIQQQSIISLTSSGDRVAISDNNNTYLYQLEDISDYYKTWNSEDPVMTIPGAISNSLSTGDNGSHIIVGYPNENATVYYIDWTNNQYEERGSIPNSENSRMVSISENADKAVVNGGKGAGIYGVSCWTLHPTMSPTMMPSNFPSFSPTANPNNFPTAAPSIAPNEKSTTKSASDFLSDYWWLILLAVLLILIIIAICWFIFCKSNNEDTEYSKERNDIEQSTDIGSNNDDEIFDAEAGNNENALLLNTENEFDDFKEDTPQYMQLQEMVELAFKTKSEDIENYHKELWKKIINVEGFKRIVHECSADVISDKEGQMMFILKLPIETAMENEIVQEVLSLLKNEVEVVKVDVAVTKRPVQDIEAMDEEQPEWQDLIKLEFKTQSEAMIHVYHKEIVGKMMDVPGFYEKVWHSKVEVIDEHNGKMRFILRQSPDTAMEDAIIERVLAILKDDARIGQIAMDENVPCSVPPTQTKPIPKLTQAIMVSFIAKVAKGESVKGYADELLERLMKIEYFRHKMYEKKITIVKEHKAKFQMVMYTGDVATAMEDPDMMIAFDILKSEKNVKRLKANVIPYFLEA